MDSKKPGVFLGSSCSSTMDHIPKELQIAFQRMWRLGFGAFHHVHVREGRLVLDPPFRVVRHARFSNARAKPHGSALALQKEHLAFQREIVAIGNGVIEVVKIHEGLPVDLEIDERL